MILDHLSDILIVIGFISIGLSVWYSLKKQKTEKDSTSHLNRTPKRIRRDNQEEE